MLFGWLSFVVRRSGLPVVSWSVVDCCFCCVLRYRVLFVVRCVLSDVRCLTFVVCCLLRAVRSLLFVVRGAMFALVCLWFD